MKIRLEILASTAIKRKKPWPHIVWLGKERQSLFLLDDKRVSVLYIPSGKTKRNVQKLSSLLPETVYITTTPGGLYLVGVQSSGELFTWHKDKDELKTICGLSTHLLSKDISLSGGCKAFPSADCSQILVVVANQHVFLWQQQPNSHDAKNNTFLGKWTTLPAPSSIQLPSPDSREVLIHAVFSSTEMLGNFCQLSFVSNQRMNLSITSLLIHFSPSVDPHNSDASFTPLWSSLVKSLSTIHPGCEPIAMKGAYVCQYTHDGQILAVAVNQKSPSQTSVLFISPFTETVQVSDIKGCGLKDASNRRGRQYWIADMSWTYDNVFLAVILRNGSAGVLSRLGEPLVLFSKGCSVEMGPAYYLPFTPLITIQSDRSRVDDYQPSINSERDPLQQRFSVSTHPTLPILLYSDGYIVTIAQLPSELSAMIFMRDLVLESSTHLRQIAETHRLDLTLANAYNLPAGELESVKHTPRGVKQIRPSKLHQHYSFEEPSVSINETLDSEVSFALGVDEFSKRSGAMENMSSGKIVFGEPEVFLMSEGSFLGEPNSTMKALQLAKINLFNVWKLAASTSDLWTTNLEKIITHAVHNIVKMFSLLLDCPQIKDLLEEATEQMVETPAIHTASLFKVITMFKQLTDLLQFDCQQRHLLAPMLQLSHKTLVAILSSTGLAQSDPRLKTLTGCFTLLKFTEKSVQQTYVMTPAGLKAKGMTPKLGFVDSQNQAGDGDLFHTDIHLSKRLVHQQIFSFLKDIQLSKRFTASWKLLYKSVLQFLSSSEETAQDIRQAQILQSAIQQCLVEVDGDIPLMEAPVLNHGERFSLDGKHTLAMNAWKEQLKNFQESGNVKDAARLFHSLLYTYILRNDLVAAVSFVDGLIVKPNSGQVEDIDPNREVSSQQLQPSLMTFVTGTLKAQALHQADMVPCIRDRAVRQVVQSLGRFMAAYFSNQMVFIFPPHSPTPLPAVHFETSIANSRIIPKYHEDMAAIIRHQKLGAVWTVERTLEYLLLGGLVCEATWFADRMGDWKAAYQLSVSHEIHKRLAPPLYQQPKKPLMLPDWLGPESIMKRRLEKLIKDDIEITSGTSDLTHLTKILEDLALAGLMGYAEIGFWLLEQLVIKLKSIVKLFPPLVTKDFYLPSPPLYCPQPARPDKAHHSLEAEDEITLRQRAASVIQLAVCVMNATHLSVPSIRWYVQELQEAQKKARQFKANTEGPCTEFPDVLFQYLAAESEFYQKFEDSSIQSALSNFRDFCSLVWLLDARDKLSLYIRSREKYLSLGLDVEDNEQWLRECFTTLQWAVNMVPFSRFFSDEASIYKVVLSLLLDLPSTEDTANILAEHMYDVDNLHPEVQERLERMLSSWQSIILRPEADGRSVGDSLDLEEDGRKSVTFLAASPRGKSLSVYFHKQCMMMDKVLKKKTQCYGSYEEFIFPKKSSKKFKLNVGSRPFETKKSYIEFLDTFVAVSFSKILEVMAGKNKVSGLPFLRVFAKDIVDDEIKFFIQRNGALAQGRSNNLSVLSGASQALARASSQGKIFSGKKFENNVPGRSFAGEVNDDTAMNKVRDGKKRQPVGLFRGQSVVEARVERSHASIQRSESEPLLDEVDLSYFVGSTPGRGGAQNLSSLASRFGQSDENLYRSSLSREQTAWSLTVNFGKKYTLLQQLVEWLEVWVNKSHALGVQGREDILDTHAKMRIRIPAQLIVLSLWLLENKYTVNTPVEVRRESPTRNRGRRSRRLSKSPFRGQSQSPPNRSSRTTSPSQHSSARSPRQRSVTPPKQKTVERLQSVESLVMSKQLLDLRNTPSIDKSSNSKQQPLWQSQQSGTQEQDEMISAYTHMLDGQDESSSLDVSSLGSDELEGSLRNTLNLIRKSALNQTIFPKDESPDRKDQSSQQFPKPKDSSTPVKAVEKSGHPPSTSLKVHNEEKVMLKKTHESVGTSPLRDSPVSERRQQNQDVGQGIASQLQGIIRDELRRIMEVQHRSVLAMMGAIDGTSPADLPKPSNSSINLDSATRHRNSQNSKLRQADAAKLKQVQENELRQSSAVKNQQAWSKEREDEETESVAEIPSLQDEMVPQSPPKMAMRRDKRGSNMREVFAELQNLQQVTYQQSKKDSQYQSSYNNLSPTTNWVYSSYPQTNEKGNLRLPLLLRPAWPEEKQDFFQFVPGQQQNMPLLKINKTMEPHDPFQNLRKYLPQVPPPQTSTSPYPPPAQSRHPPFSQTPALIHIPPTPQPYLFAVPPPPPQSFPAPQLLNIPPPPYMHNPPSLPPDQMPASGFPLLKLLPPGHQVIEVKDRVEETRRRLLSQFHQQILHDKENLEKNILGQHMLHLEDGSGPESARSEKSRSSGRSPSRSESEQVVSEHLEKPTSAQASQAAPQVADATTSDTQISHGFAFPPGVFESYLQLGEHLVGPDVNQTNAAFQLKMALAMQKQVEKRIRTKVDFSTMTQEQVDMAMSTDPAMEVIRTAEAATSITKDTGVDPVQEVLNDYNMKLHNNILPPDIFMGLRFGEQAGSATSGAPPANEHPGQGRAYLNVVDIRASSILRDIPEQSQRAGLGEDDLDSAVLQSQNTVNQIEAIEGVLREKLAPNVAKSGAPRGFDSVTVKLFEQLKASKDSSISMAVLPHSSVSESKAAMMRRLRDMSDQMKLIDEMSQNIERDFKSSHMLLTTIQDVNASIQRSRSPSPTRSKGKKYQELRYSLEEDDDEKKSLPPGSARSPKVSARSPQTSARSVKSRSGLSTGSREVLSASESDLTELITEVLAQEGVDLQAAGYSQELAQQLEKDVREKIQMDRQGQTPRDRLKSMKREGRSPRAPADREMLKHWMTEKFHQRNEEYKRRRRELVEREPKPFKSQSKITRVNLKTLDEELTEKRINMMSEFMNQRILEAEHLIGDIMVDRPQIPWDPEPRKRRLPSKSPKRFGSTASTSPTRQGPMGVRKSRSPTRRTESVATSSYKPASSSHSPPGIRSKQSRDSTPVKGILKATGKETQLSSTDLYFDHRVLSSISEADRSVDSSADLIQYAKRVLEADNRDENSPPMSFLEAKPQQPQRAAPQSPGAKRVLTPRGKSYAEMVRLQRPEATRKWKEINRQRHLQEVRKAAQQDTLNKSITQNINTPKAKTKEYGSKQMPSSSTRQIVTRRVKTYSERLQEMKPTKRLTNQAVRGAQGSVKTSSATMPSTSQYVPSQRLDQPHAKATSTHKQTSQQKTSLPLRTFMRSHGPLHKPKTYAEQLQELNPHPHHTDSVHTRPAMQSTVTVRHSVSRSQVRPRPYNDPYSDMDYEELASVLSDWEIDENVRGILYGGSTATSSMAYQVDELDMSMSGGDPRTHMAPSEGQSDYFDAIMQRREPFRVTDEFGAGDYRSSVDIQEIERIADAVSVGSGSVLSVIDWDAVEDLIKSV
ncbi:ciliogenesis and planar polarity effector 1-like [Physella acuta]|uniref:ciliogenesis and planar polarity effector 1-like n=1 Tax=Physella acuta TaxID=109671 RepID=UPI0027DD5F36|nr:ciliogenesis and planar polarity effector 1-like [Physella acuta]